jgi:hypothetical protein
VYVTGVVKFCGTPELGYTEAPVMEIVGASDAKAQYVKDRMVSMGDLYATIYKAFGIDWEKTYMSPIGRPIKIANSIDDKTGVPLKELA